MKKVCVIGAGPSGITAIKNLRDEGVHVTCYDFNGDVGGNWIYSEDESHSSVFETTHIISSKTLSQYEDFTFDDFESGIPDYPSHDQLRRYFQAYAQTFDLYPHIQFNSLVKNCNLNEDGTWTVTVEHDQQLNATTFDALVVCNGHHWNPRYPDYPGTFSGEYLHSHNFKKAAPFANKKVLVIGGGNSACDVAVETSRVSTQTVISMRRGYRIIPKFLFGKPSDIVASKMNFLPTKLKYWLSEKTVSILLGPNKNYGLAAPTQSVSETHPTINDELLHKLRHGKVLPKGDIERFEEDRVVFTDGTSETFDTIIACTGYILSHPFFEKSFLDYSKGHVPLYLKMFHEEIENLYFVGMFQPLGCIWPGAELQAKLVAKELSGKWVRPKNMKELCRREVEKPHLKQVNSPRHTITVDYHSFVKSLKKELKRAE